jgi:hypothetical protein
LNQAWVWTPALPPTYKLCDLGEDQLTPPSLDSLLQKLGVTYSLRIRHEFCRSYI